MKRVFTNSDDVIHLWANKVQEDARCGNVFFTEPKKIYSYGYHYLLAEFLDNNTVMINDMGYSVTTSKHISQVRYGTRQYKQFFISETTLKYVIQEVRENYEKLARARKPELYINRINYLWDRVNEFIDWQKKNKQYKNAKSEQHYRDIKKIVNTVNNGDLKVTQASLVKAQKAEENRIKRANAKRLKEKLQEFEAYEIRTFRVGKEDFLRVSKDGENVETSQGVKIPVKDSAILYKLIEAGRDVQGHRIGHYNVSSINGTLKIGCHNINMDSVHKVGKLITA